MADRKFIKIGTKVNTQWGEAKVTGIELCENGEKYGIDIDKIFVADKNRCTFDMDNGHWSYGYWWGQHRNRKCTAVRGRSILWNA